MAACSLLEGVVIANVFRPPADHLGMHAVQFAEHGDRDVLEYAEFADPEPDRDEVLVDVKAGALNHLDVWTRIGFGALGRLDLDLLNCDGQTLPVAWERVGEGARMIVFENAGSFLVARGALLNAASPPYGLIAYGGGNQVVRTAAYLSEISDQLSIDYVGDLDAHGIEIALRFADAVRRETGFPIRPAARVHEAMLQAAAELGHPQGWPAGSASKTTRIQDWLPPEYAEDAAAIIQTGNRIPEEVLHGGHYRRIGSEN